MSMPDFANISGVGIGALAVFLFFILASRHIEKNTGAIHKLAEAIKDLEIFLKHYKQ